MIDSKLRRLKTSKTQVCAAAIALGVLLSACSSGGDKAGKEDATLRIALSTPLLWPEVSVATGAGLWAKHGIKPTITDFPTGNEANQAMLGNSADIATVAPAPVVLSAAQNAPVRIIGSAGYWERWRVQLPESSGVKDPADLKGKKIGVSIGTSSEIGFSQFLAQNNMTAKDVNVINVRPQDMVPSIRSGSVDAVNVWQPFTYRVEQILKGSFTQLDYTYRNNYLFVTTDKFLNAQPEKVKVFLKVMAEAAKIIADSPDDAAKYVSEAAGMSVADTKAVLKEYVAIGGPADEGVTEEIETILAFASANGTLPKGSTVDLKKLIVSMDGR